MIKLQYMIKNFAVHQENRGDVSPLYSSGIPIISNKMATKFYIVRNVWTNKRNRKLQISEPPAKFAKIVCTSRKHGESKLQVSLPKHDVKLLQSSIGNPWPWIF